MSSEPEPVEPPPPVQPVATTPAEALRPVAAEALPPLVDGGEWATLRKALERNRGWLARRGERTIDFGVRQVPASELLKATNTLLGWLAADPTPEAFGAQVAQHFDFVESVGGETGRVLVTGYYEPEIAASRTRQPGYEVPIYGSPGVQMVRVDLGAFDDTLRGRRIAGVLRGNRLEPFADRRALRESEQLRGREIAWAANPIDLFFLEVQGSGRLRFPDGSFARIGYAGANGRPYRSIGKLLIEEGAVPREEMSMQAIRSWLEANPDEMHRVLDHNLSQVFFRRLDGPPLGNLGIPVTPERSLAVDQSLLPPGAIGFLATDLPRRTADGQREREGDLWRFIVVQDTGGAIRGAGRADFFWGPGETAAMRAGVMQETGRVLFLVPREAG